MNYKLRRSIQQLMVVGITATFATGAFAALGQQNPPPGPSQVPDYFGIVPNFANSPEPVLAVVSGGTGTGAAVTTYDYANWLPTQGVTDVQGGTGYAVGDVLTITGGAVGATCTVTVNNVSTDSARFGAIIPNVDATGTVTGSGVTIDSACNTGFTTPIAGTGIHKFLDALPGIPGVSSYLTGAGYDANGANLLGQSLPVAVADTTTFPTVGTTPASDYYEIAEVEYTKQLHSDLPATHLRGYVQIKTGGFNVAAYTTLSGAAKLAYANQYANYLGPIIVAQKGKAVRIKLVNLLSTGAAGKLPVPVDTTYMGADTTLSTDNRTALHLHGGNTPWISDGTPRQTVKPKGEGTSLQNKGASVRDVPDMWFDASGNLLANSATCTQGSTTCTTAGATNNPGDGSLTFYFTNQQSARLMFYHDHAEGITRLNVYTGMAAGYIIQDPTEQGLVANGTLPGLPDTIPLVIQEKTFVPNNTKPVMNFYAAFASQLKSQDPTWRWGTTGLDANGNVVSTGPNGNGDLWVPHVFMPNQNPGDITGGNAMGRWDYGPWFWPPFTAISNGPITNPYYDPLCNTTTSYCEPTQIPGVPNGSTAGVFNTMTNAQTSSPSGTPEAFNDTPLVNGTAYPYINVDPKQYRLRLLSVGNDRMLNLSLVIAASKNAKTTADDNAGSTSAAAAAALCDGSTTVSANPADCTEVRMVPFTATQNAAGNTPFPSHWYTQQKGGVTFDGRPSGVFDPKTRGPAMVQIGTEGGFLSSPVVIKNQPVNYEYNPKNILIGNIKEHALLLGPAERADVLVDFSNYAGSTLIMYNDAPAPVPAWDLRLDYYTGNFDNTDTGGAFSTIPGYGPNTRTVMQIRVSTNGGTVAANQAASRDSTGTINMGTLTPAIQTAFRTSQEPIIVPQAAYNTTYGLTGTNAVPDSLGTDLSRIADYQLTFKPIADANPIGGAPATLQSTAVTMDMAPKTIIEDWTMNWGRMNALLGTEVPRTTSTIQTSIPQAYIDPPTELVKITPNTNATPIGGTLADGTSLWKITHNGVDSHSIHFHLFHVQLVNRVGWDGAIYPPEANELGWKDSVLMHPLSDVVVALRPMKMDLPFKVANSHRKIDPSLNASGTDFFNLNPMTGNAANVAGNNLDMNYGWEYVWHCHILGHEENDMMRAIAVAQPPEAPTALTATTVTTGNASQKGIRLNWTDNSMISNWVEIQRATDSGFLKDTTNTAAGNPVTVYSVLMPECTSQANCARTWTDTEANSHTTTSYYYKLVANNTVGGGAGRADKPLVAVAGGGWDYGALLPAAVNSLVPNLVDAVTGVNGYTGYANVTASSDAANVSRLMIPVASVSPGSITFPQTAIGSTNPTTTAGRQVITISNTGAGILNVSGISLTGSFARGTNATATNVLYRGSCPTTATFTLAAGANCTYNVTFSPTAALCTGASCNGTLTVTDNSNNVAGSTQTVSLSGTTVPPAIPTTPATPTAASVTATGLTLNWTAVTGATSYTVQRATAAAGPWTTIGSPTAATLGVTGLTGNTTYYFQVSATNAVGTSAYSTVKSQLTIPALPTAVTAANGTVGNPITAGLTWTAPVGGATSYNVRYATNQLTILLASPGINGTNVTSGQQITVPANVRFMEVQAVNATGTTAWSAATGVLPQ